jgi:hypothetical protein
MDDDERTYKTLKASPMRSQLPQQGGDGHYQHGSENLREKRHGNFWRLESPRERMWSVDWAE